MSTKKSLGFWMLSALVVGNIVGSGVFLLPSTLAKYGTISILSWVITAVGAMALALVFARLSQMIPKVGGPYAYCHDAFGNFIGFQIAYNYWMAVWIGNAALVTALLGYLSFFFPQLENPLIATLTSVGFVWLFTFVNIRGVQTAAFVQLVTTILKLLPLFIITLVGLFFIKKGNLLQFNLSGETNWQAITSIIPLTLWAFIGLESATVPADDVENPKKNIPKATIFGTLLAAITYILATIAVMGMIPSTELVTSNFPFASAAHVIFGPIGAWFVAAGAVIACVGTLNGWILIQGQVPMAAAQDHLFPEAFGKRNKMGTPVLGLIISSTLVTVLLVLRYGVDLVDQFQFIVTLAVFFNAVPYLYTSFAEVLLYFENPKVFSIKRLSVALLIAGVGFTFSLWALWGSGKDVIYYGFLLFIMSVPIYLWMRYSKNKQA
jgi:basic amino acid/polyamine antiporter, APA family